MSYEFDPDILDQARRVVESYDQKREYVNGRMATSTEIVLARELLKASRPEAVTIDPGTEKILRTLLDRAYAMMAMSGYRVAEVNADHNNPIIAWMSDAAAVLYGSGRRPDPVADLQGTPRSPLAKHEEKP